MPDAAISSSATAVLDSLIHGCKSAVSFRLLSARLSIPTRRAQALLLSYISSHPPDALCVLWAVTHTSSDGIRRISLTTSPASIASPLSQTVWSVAPPTLSVAPSPAAAWLAADAAADLEAVAAPPTENNALRDGRYNAIRSSTAVWKPAETAVGVVQKKVLAVKAVRKTSALLAEVKAKVKARDAKRAATRNRQAAAMPWRPAGEGASLFGSKRLGADAAKRIREGERKENERKEKGDSGEEKGPVKKGRRLIEDDEDEDEEEESDGEKERLAMEKEATEREAAEREAADAERAELQREVAELTRQHEEDEVEDEPESPELRDLGEGKQEEDKPESPELRDLGEGKQEEDKQESPNRSPAKRKLNEAFGLPSASGPRRIRREVEETVEKGGYLVTRRVTKMFDENGNELVDEEKPKAEMAKPKSPPKSGFGKPLKPLNSQNGKSVKPKLGSLKKEKGKDGKRPSSKVAANGGAKKTPKKKIKGNIMSYFGKK